MTEGTRFQIVVGLAPERRSRDCHLCHFPTRARLSMAYHLITGLVEYLTRKEDFYVIIVGQLLTPERQVNH